MLWIDIQSRQGILEHTIFEYHFVTMHNLCEDSFKVLSGAGAKGKIFYCSPFCQASFIFRDKMALITQLW